VLPAASSAASTTAINASATSTSTSAKPLAFDAHRAVEPADAQQDAPAARGQRDPPAGRTAVGQEPDAAARVALLLVRRTVEHQRDAGWQTAPRALCHLPGAGAQIEIDQDGLAAAPGRRPRATQVLRDRRGGGIGIRPCAVAPQRRQQQHGDQCRDREGDQQLDKGEAILS
jgi:hypothetical protein